MAMYDDNKSTISKIGDLTKYEIAKRQIQKFFKEPVDRLIEKEYMHFEDDGLHITKPVKFIAQTNDFKWPFAIVVHFEDGDVYNGSTIELRDQRGVFDIRSWDVSSVYNLKMICGRQYVPFSEVKVDLLDTSFAHSIENCFFRFARVKSLDLSSWDLRNIENADGAFSRMANLESIKFLEQNLSYLKSTIGMFNASGNWRAHLDLTPLHPKCIEDARDMFKDSKFEEIDMRDWKFTKDCEFDGFAKNARELKVFNGINLQSAGFKAKNGWDWTDACKSILMEQNCLV